jgi:hypothetical protein
MIICSWSLMSLLPNIIYYLFLFVTHFMSRRSLSLHRLNVPKLNKYVLFYADPRVQQGSILDCSILSTGTAAFSAVSARSTSCIRTSRFSTKWTFWRQRVLENQSESWTFLQKITHTKFYNWHNQECLFLPILRTLCPSWKRNIVLNSCFLKNLSQQ